MSQFLIIVKESDFCQIGVGDQNSQKNGKASAIDNVSRNPRGGLPHNNEGVARRTILRVKLMD